LDASLRWHDGEVMHVTALKLTENAAEAARAEVDAYFEALQQKSLLRFLTCGSVDDGKSTLVGRLLYDARLLLEDQLSALERESAKAGATGGDLDFSLLVDGLAAEREQGITIDVAYRFFATEKRKFIIADTPGHEQYTRNMATGASTADLAIILIDARKGVLPQTRRHSFLVHLLGIRHVVLAVNKMDLVGHDEARFDEIVADYRGLADEIGISDFTAIPVAAKSGDNVATRSGAMAWYAGPALLEHLETVPIEAAGAAIAPFRMAVQWVNRPGQDFRGYAGTIASGRVRTGDAVAILPSGRTTRIARIVTAAGDLDEAAAGQAVTLTLTDEVDCSRGDLIAAAGAATVAATLDAALIWMAEAELEPHRAYWLKTGAQLVSATVTPGEIVAIDENGSRTGPGLTLNDIGKVRIALDRRIAATLYADNRALGGFILINKATHATVAAGMIGGFPSSAVSDAHVERIFWVPGETQAEILRARFAAQGRSAFILTEAALREGLCSDLGPEDAAELVRRAAEVARLMSATGATIIAALSGVRGVDVPGSLVGFEAGGEASGEDWVI
jgi:bifunctional enzyme CysN/CysC